MHTFDSSIIIQYPLLFISVYRFLFSAVSFFLAVSKSAGSGFVARVSSSSPQAPVSASKAPALGPSSPVPLPWSPKTELLPSSPSPFTPESGLYLCLSS